MNWLGPFSGFELFLVGRYQELKQEYRVTWRREGGKQQYKTFQRYPTLLRYARKIILTSRDDLQPLVLLEFSGRATMPWQKFDIPDIDTESMIKEGTS